MTMMKKIVKQEIKLWENNGPKGVLLNRFCCVSFKDEGKYKGIKKLCANVKGKEKLCCGFIIGFSPTHWDMWDARTFDDAYNIGKLNVK